MEPDAQPAPACINLCGRLRVEIDGRRLEAQLRGGREARCSPTSSLTATAPSAGTS